MAEQIWFSCGRTATGFPRAENSAALSRPHTPSSVTQEGIAAAAAANDECTIGFVVVLFLFHPSLSLSLLRLRVHYIPLHLKLQRRERKEGNESLRREKLHMMFTATLKADQV